MLRLLIKDITVEKLSEERRAVLHVRWQGGANEDIIVQLPAPIAEQLRYPIEIIEKIRALACTMRDEEIATELNAQGLRSATGKAYTVSIISWVRYRYRIPPVDLKRPNELTVNEVMVRFCISRNVVYYWIECDVVEARQLKHGTPYWITLTPSKEKELEDWVRNSTRIDTPVNP